MGNQQVSTLGTKLIPIPGAMFILQMNLETSLATLRVETRGYSPKFKVIVKTGKRG